MRKITILFSMIFAFGLFANAQTNLLQNPGFENWENGKPTGWSVYGAKNNVTEDTSLKLEGAKSLKVAIDEKGSKVTVNQMVDVVEGKTYTLSVSYRLTVGNGGRVWGNFKKADGKTTVNIDGELKAALQGPNNYFEVVEGWQTYTTDFVVPAGAAKFVFEVRSYKNTTINWDKMSLVEKAGAGVTPQLGLSAAKLNFKALEGEKSTAQTLKVSAANLTKVPTYVVSGTDKDQFQVTGTLAKEGGDLSVTFAPTSTGNKTATIEVTYEDGKKTVELIGAATGADNPYGLDDSAPLNELNEEFLSQELPDGWKSVSLEGGRVWQPKSYNKNNYVQMTAYGNSAEKTRSILISPAVKVDNKTSLTFDWNAGHANGATLIVNIMGIDGKLTPLKTITATEPVKGYGKFATETIDLSTYKGAKFIVFEYNGSKTPSHTTTYQIDNVKVSTNSTGVFSTKASSLNIWKNQSGIVFNAKAGEVISVYSVTGQQLISKVAVEGENTISTTANGVVIVKVGNRIGKVIL